MNEKTNDLGNNLDQNDNHRPLPKILKYIVTGIAFIMGLYHLVAAGYFPLPGILHPAVHLGFGLALIFIFFPLVKKARRSKVILALDVCFAALMLIITVYVFMSFETYSDRVGLPPTLMDMILGVALLIFLIEAARRCMGWVFPIITLAFAAYAMLGQYLPEPFTHRGFSLSDMVGAYFLNQSGIYGDITGVCANFILLFIMFAAFVRKSGVGAFIKDISMAILGSMRGGPAKMAVCASSAMGMFTGSSMANCAGVGSFTIPLMKQTGYTSEFAAGIEASSGLGAQIMPPVLGGAAFIMVGILGISYNTIALASLPIALIFYIGLFLSVDYGAVRLNLSGLPRTELPKVWPTLKRGWYQLTPLVILILMITVMGTSMAKAGFWAIVSVPVISFISGQYRMSFRDMGEAIIDGIKSALPVVGVVGSASLISGIVSVTGLGLQLSNILISLSGGNVLVLLILTAISSIILGMGLPVIVCYTLLAVLVAPALVTMGIQPLAAHMFIFYYGILAAITPPVAGDCFVTAGIAKCSPFKTGIEACKIAMPIFLIPFFFTFNMELIHPSISIYFFWRFICGVLGVYSLASGFQGIMLPNIRLNLPERIFLFALGIALLYPGLTSDFIALPLLVVIQVFTWLRAKKKKRQIQTESGKSV